MTTGAVVNSLAAFANILRIVAIAAPCVVLVAGSCASAAEAELVVAPNAAVAGHAQDEWSRRWWVWASSFPHDKSPLADRTGRLCNAGQQGSVWFLAGTFEAALVERRCTIPRGKYLFFPLINFVVFPGRNASMTCAEAIEQAKVATDAPEILVAEIDGSTIPNLERHRQRTPGCFDLAARADIQVVVSPSAANGYYLMLSPLSPGRHTLRFGGELAGFRQAISYELEIE